MFHNDRDLFKELLLQMVREYNTVTLTRNHKIQADERDALKNIMGCDDKFRGKLHAHYNARRVDRSALTMTCLKDEFFTPGYRPRVAWTRAENPEWWTLSVVTNDSSNM